MKLTEDVKRFIVQELARYETPTDIAASVKETFGIVVDRRQVHEYNPLALHKAPVAKKWAALFERTREAFLKDTSDIGIAQKSVRLRHLDRMAVSARARGNHVLAAQLMEQAAKECGGSFTNRRELTGANGEPLGTASDLTDEELEARIAARLRKAAP